MYIDSRKLEKNSIVEGDICIIGAGAAGVSIALDWINSGYNVILLEGGGFEYDEEVQQLYDGEVSGQKYYPIMSTRIHMFGGSTNCWGGFCSPFDDIDFKKRDWVNNSGWPITNKDLEDYYKRTKKVLELHDDNYSLEYWQKNDPTLVKFPFDNDLISNKMWQFSPPSRFLNIYRDTISESKNINLYTYANVTNITANELSSKIEEVEIKSTVGKSHKVRASQFILACGAIQNARILLSSNKQISNGIGNQNDVVGRYFMEHFELQTSEVWFSKDYPMKLYKNIPGETKARAELGLKETVQEKYKILNGTLSFVPLLKSKTWKPMIERRQHKDPFYDYAKNSNSIVQKIKRKLSKVKDGNIKNIENAYSIFTRMEQEPKSFSRISLSNEKDSLGMPKTHLKWNLNNIEKKSLRTLNKVVAKQMGISDIGRMKLAEFLVDEDDNTWSDSISFGRHHMGTTRMDNDPKKGVVDSDCKVHGISNLYVAGSSCFPTSGAANPTFTLVALSLRLSDHIKNIISTNT